MARVLRPGGLLLLSAFGPDTARELRESFLQELPRARPLPFPDMHDLGDMLMAAGVVAPVMECEPLRLVYPDVRALLREARALGGNPRPDRMRGLPSGRAARAVLRNLQGRREPDGRVALSFELVFGHGWKGRAAHAHGAAAAAGAWQTVKFGGRTP
jgi:malonyl-CoA O-methyltransferase